MKLYECLEEAIKGEKMLSCMCKNKFDRKSIPTKVIFTITKKEILYYSEVQTEKKNINFSVMSSSFDFIYEEVEILDPKLKKNKFYYEALGRERE